MLIPMHGDELLIVHFSEPKTHPIVGSSKRQRWQVRTSATRAREVEDRRNGRVGSLQVPCPAGSPLIQSHPLPGLSHPSFPAPLSHLPFPTVKPIMTSTPTNIWAFIMEFWGEGKPLRGALWPFSMSLNCRVVLTGSLSKSYRRYRAIFLTGGGSY